MAEAVLVRRSESGTFDIVGDPEDWTDVCSATDSQVCDGPLLGWGKYQSVWVVQQTPARFWYFCTVPAPADAAKKS
jgi:hypothetical protein